MNPNWKTTVISETHPIGGGRWVSVIAHIRKNATGEVRKYETSEPLFDDEDHPSVFNWEENNFCCDCNREAFFERAGGHDMEWDDMKCGDGGFSVNLENPVTGEIYYREFETEGKT